MGGVSKDRTTHGWFFSSLLGVNSRRVVQGFGAAARGKAAGSPDKAPGFHGQVDGGGPKC